MTYLFGDNQGTFTKPNFVLDFDESKDLFTITHMNSGILYAVLPSMAVTACKSFSDITDALLIHCPKHSVVQFAQSGINAINQIAHRNLNNRFHRQFQPGKF